MHNVEVLPRAVPEQQFHIEVHSEKGVSTFGKAANMDDAGAIFDKAVEGAEMRANEDGGMYSVRLVQVLYQRNVVTWGKTNEN